VGDGICCRGIERMGSTASGTRRRRGVVRSVRYARASASTGTLEFSTHKKFFKLALPVYLQTACVCCKFPLGLQSQRKPKRGGHEVKRDDINLCAAPQALEALDSKRDSRVQESSHVTNEMPATTQTRIYCNDIAVRMRYFGQVDTYWIICTVDEIPESSGHP
jgi:hypothetical protein